MQRKAYVYTLFNRLVMRDGGLNFDYMGAAEYEFGSAHNALNLLVNDLGVPHEIIETNMILTREESPLRYQGAIDKKSYQWKRLTKHQKEGEIRMRTEIETLLDGSPLLLRYVPAITDPEELGPFLAARSLNDLNNKGGMWREDTRAWLGLAPAASILYHPSRTEEVETFLTRILAVRREKEPDDALRALKALTSAVHDNNCAVSRDMVNAVLADLRSGALTPDPF